MKKYKALVPWFLVFVFIFCIGAYRAQVIPTLVLKAATAFTDADTTPDVSGGTFFKAVDGDTTNTIISDFDAGSGSLTEGHVLFIYFADAYFDIDFSSSGLKGNGDVDWTNIVAGDSMWCVYDSADWHCVISTAGASVLNDLGDPTASKTFTMGAYKITLTTASDGADTLEIESTVDNNTAEAVSFKIRLDCSNTDAECVALWLRGDDDGDGTGAEDILKIVGSASGWVATGALILNTDSTNYASIGNYKVNNVGFNTAFAVEGSIVGELLEIDDGDIAGDDLTLAQLRGTHITNEGAGGAVEYDLETAESGLHFIATCAELFDIDFETKGTDKVYIHDDDAITITGDGDVVTMDCTAVSEDMVCYTWTQNDTDWDWICKCGVGACTDGGAGAGN